MVRLAQDKKLGGFCDELNFIQFKNDINLW